MTSILRLPRTIQEPKTQKTETEQLTHQQAFQRVARELGASLADLQKTLTLSLPELKMVENVTLQLSLFNQALEILSHQETDGYRREIAAWLVAKDLDYFARISRWFEESGLWGKYLDRKLHPLAERSGSQATNPTSSEQEVGRGEVTAPVPEPPREEAFATEHGLVVRPRSAEARLPLAEQEDNLSYFGEIESDNPLPEGIFMTTIMNPVDASGRQLRVDGQLRSFTLPDNQDFPARSSGAIDITLPLVHADQSTHPIDLPMPLGYRVTAIHLARGQESGQPRSARLEQNTFGLVNLPIDPGVQSVRYRLEPTALAAIETQPDWLVATPLPPRPEDQFVAEFLKTAGSRQEQVNLIAGSLHRRQPVYTTHREFQHLMVRSPNFYAFQDALGGPMGDCKHFALVMANELRRHGISSLVTSGLSVGRSPSGQQQFKTIGHEQTLFIDEAGQLQTHDAVRVTDRQTLLNDQQVTLDLPTARRESQGSPDTYLTYLTSRRSAWRRSESSLERPDAVAQGLDPTTFSQPTPEADQARVQAELFADGLELTMGRKAYEQALTGEDPQLVVTKYARLAKASNHLRQTLRDMVVAGLVPTHAPRALLREDDQTNRATIVEQWLRDRLDQPAVRQILIGNLALYQDEYRRLSAFEQNLNDLSYEFTDQLTVEDVTALEPFQQRSIFQNLARREMLGHGQHTAFLLNLIRQQPEIIPHLSNTTRQECKWSLTHLIVSPKPDVVRLAISLELVSRLERSDFPAFISELVLNLAALPGDHEDARQRFQMLAREPSTAPFFTSDGQASIELRQALITYLATKAHSDQQSGVLLQGYARDANLLIHRLAGAGLELKSLVSPETAQKLCAAELTSSRIRGLGNLGYLIDADANPDELREKIYHQPTGDINPSQPVGRLLLEAETYEPERQAVTQASRSAAILEHYFGLDADRADPARTAARERQLAETWLTRQIEDYLSDPANDRSQFGREVLGDPAMIEATLGSQPTVEKIKQLAGLKNPPVPFARPETLSALATDPRLSDRLRVAYADLAESKLFESRYLHAYLAGLVSREQFAAGHLLLDQMSGLDEATRVAVAQPISELATKALRYTEQHETAEGSASKNPDLNPQKLATHFKEIILAHIPSSQKRAEIKATLREVPPQLLVTIILAANTNFEDIRRDLLGEENEPDFSINIPAKAEIAGYPSAGLGLTKRLLTSAPDTFWANQLRREMFADWYWQPNSRRSELEYFSEFSSVYPAAKTFVDHLPAAARVGRQHLFANGFGGFIRRFGTAQFARSASGEFHQLRDYQLGDDAKLIDWNATARFGKTVVRETKEQKKSEPYHYLVDLEWLDGRGYKDEGLSANLQTLVGILYQGLSEHKAQTLHLTFRGNVVLSLSSAELNAAFQKKELLDDELGQRSQLLDFVLSLNYAAVMAKRVRFKEEIKDLPPLGRGLVHLEKNGQPWQPGDQAGTALILTDNQKSVTASQPIFRAWHQRGFDIIKLNVSRRT